MTGATPLLLLAFVLGLDSLRASAGLASAGLSRGHAARLWLSFGICDSVAPLVGLVVGRSALAPARGWLDGIGPLALAACAVYLVLCRSWARRHADRDPWLIVVGVPLTLSLDNLVAGAALGVYGYPTVVSALVLGAASAALAIVGTAVGRAIGVRVTAHAELAGAAVLLLVALSLAAEQL